jgi:hydantoinase/carbamoylase family amidase
MTPGDQIMSLENELQQDLAALERFGYSPDAGFRRLAWSRELRASLDWLASRMTEAGLDVTLDPAGNLLGRWGTGSGPAILIGSHFDTVERGGRLDGALGVLAGLEVVRRLQRHGPPLSRPVWVIAFMDEEGVRFGEAMLGSRAFTGEALDPDLGERVDSSGESLAAAMAAWGRRPESAHTAHRVSDVGVYIELHIEQGPVLDATAKDIGIVTAIVGLEGLQVTVEGQPNHAGTTPMSYRRDPVAAAARLISSFDAAAREGEFLATVGKLTVERGGMNTIAGRCEFSVDLRAGTADALTGARRRLDQLVEAARGTHRVKVRSETLYRIDPAEMSPAVVDSLEHAAHEVGATTLRMSSGAGHDAMVLSRKVPTGMLFVPSRGGISHAPQEHTDERAIELAVRALEHAVRELVKDIGPGR